MAPSSQRVAGLSFPQLVHFIVVIPPVNDNLEATAQAVFQDQFASYYGCDKLPEGYSIVSLDRLFVCRGLESGKKTKTIPVFYRML